MLIGPLHCHQDIKMFELSYSSTATYVLSLPSTTIPLQPLREGKSLMVLGEGEAEAIKPC